MGRWLRRAVALALVAVLVLAGAIGWIFQQLRSPYRNWDGESTTVSIPSGASAAAALQALAAAGVVERPQLVRRYLSWRGQGDQLQAGEYRFDRPLTPLQAIERLRDGDVLLHPITLPEGLSRREIAAALAEREFGEEEAFLAAFNTAVGVAELDPDATDLEGYLFPETYHFSRTTTVEQIAATMVRRFRTVTGEGYRQAAETAGLSLRQAVTLASMIEKETSIEGERREIAAVFHNRIKKRMLMQCDPTVMYALAINDQPVAKLYSKHLKFDSPYNTYRYPGLPPGPIANPGEASLRAAVEPNESDSLYFVAKPGGGHTFSPTLEEHNRAVRVWRRYARSLR